MALPLRRGAGRPPVVVWAQRGRPRSGLRCKSEHRAGVEGLGKGVLGSKALDVGELVDGWLVGEGCDGLTWVCVLQAM